MDNNAKQVIKGLQQFSTPDRAKNSTRFSKTGAGEYGEGDTFIGVTVPEQRKIAKQFRDLELSEVVKLLKSSVHEHRLTALIILVDQFKRGNDAKQRQIYDLYLENTAYINNWDLVDSSAPYIVGSYLWGRDRSVLYELAQSKDLWERRIAMLATFYFINQGESKDALAIAELLVDDQHDLIQKATGWMLREVGKRCSREVEEEFLRQRYKTMPRTTLRYAIERFELERRQQYLKSLI